MPHYLLVKKGKKKKYVEKQIIRTRIILLFFWSHLFLLPSSLHPLLPSFHKGLLSICYVSGTVLGTRTTSESKTKSPHLGSLCFRNWIFLLCFHGAILQIFWWKSMLLFSHYVMSDSLWPNGLQHTRLLCPTLYPRVCSNSCPLSQWCYLYISSSATLFSFCFNFSQHQCLFQWVSSLYQVAKNYRASVSVIPMNIQGQFPLGLTGLIFFQSREPSRVFSSTNPKVSINSCI